MTTTAKLVQLALNHHLCSQKEMAKMMKVSASQISFWKNGGPISDPMLALLTSLSGVDDLDPSLVEWAGSVPDAKKWNRLFLYLGNEAHEKAVQTDFPVVLLPFDEEIDLLPGRTVHGFKEMGIQAPKPFPATLDFDYDEWSEEGDKTLVADPIASLTMAIYASYADLYCYFSTFVYDLMHDDDLDLLGTPAANLESCLIDLATIKIAIEPVSIAPNWYQFKLRTQCEYRDWLLILRDAAITSGKILRTDIMEMSEFGHDDLKSMAEMEAGGESKNRQHPDVFMNQLLVGVESNRQMLRAICEKLGIHYMALKD